MSSYHCYTRSPVATVSPASMPASLLKPTSKSSSSPPPPKSTSSSRSPTSGNGSFHRRNTGSTDDEDSESSVCLINHCPWVTRASQELDHMRATGKQSNFPSACLTLLKSLDGNTRCVDCGEHDPQWAAVSYGALICLHCSGHHRGLGVNISTVRSVTMDEWCLDHVLAMLEGGNRQLTQFFERHHLSASTLPSAPSSLQNSPVKEDHASATLQDPPSPSAKLVPFNEHNVTRLRYKTKAALFYRQQMQVHVKNVLKQGQYQGREMSRKRSKLE